MRKRFAVLGLLLLLTGCAVVQGESMPSASQTAPTQSSTVISETITAPSVLQVSPLAREDFLEFDRSSYPREHPVEFVMLHFTSAVMLNRENPYDYDLVRGIFEDNNLGIHYLIDREGVIYCFLPESRSAWHAGKGSFSDEKYTDNMNRHSIGIELMGIGSQKDMSIYLHPQEYDALDDSLKGFTQAQYTALAKLVGDICSRQQVPVNREHIIGHQQYNPSKNDPGELFDWAYFMGLLQGE